MKINLTCEECYKKRALLLAEQYKSSISWYIFRLNDNDIYEYVSGFVKDSINGMTTTTCTDRDNKMLFGFKNACEIRNNLNSLLGYERNVWIINNSEG